MKYLIVGLGNIGPEYAHTRHNIGFDIADELVKSLNGSFDNIRLAYYSEVSFKGKKLHVIKPTTFMNLSGKACMRYDDFFIFATQEGAVGEKLKLF